MSNEYTKLKGSTHDNKMSKYFREAATIIWSDRKGCLSRCYSATQDYSYQKPNWVILIPTCGRIRPLHTKPVIFAFVGNASIAGILFTLCLDFAQKLLCGKQSSQSLVFTFGVWQLIILAAAITLPLGFTTSKEYC